MAALPNLHLPENSAPDTHLRPFITPDLMITSTVHAQAFKLEYPPLEHHKFSLGHLHQGGGSPAPPASPPPR